MSTRTSVIWNGLEGEILERDPRGLIRAVFGEHEREFTYRTGLGYHLRGEAPGLGQVGAMRATALYELRRFETRAAAWAFARCTEGSGYPSLRGEPWTVEVRIMEPGEESAELVREICGGVS